MPPQGTRRGQTRTSLTFAGTIVVTCPPEGRIVAVPSVTARMILDGPGGRVVDQLPFGPVVTTATWLNAPESFSGAARIRTGWPDSGTPEAVVYSPASVTLWPCATSSVLVTWTCGGWQIRRSRKAYRPVWTRLVEQRSTYLTTLIVFRCPPRLTRMSLWWRRTVAQCHPTRTRSRTTRRCSGSTIRVRLTGSPLRRAAGAPAAWWCWRSSRRCRTTSPETSRDRCVRRR